MVGKAIIGVYAGNQINMASVGPIIQEFAERVASHLVDETAAQLCHDGFLNTHLNTQCISRYQRESLSSTGCRPRLEGRKMCP